MADKGDDTVNGDKRPDEDIVSPWEVHAASQRGVDYGKIIRRFGCVDLSDTVVAELERIIKRPAHQLLRRGFVFAHRDFDLLLNHFNTGNPFYLYTGRGPSSEAMHLGHLIPFLLNKWFQDVFNVPMIIQMTDDEKYLWKNLRMEEAENLAIENAKDIIACGFNPDKTFIFTDLSYIGTSPEFFRNMIRIQRCVTMSQAKGIFGFTDGDCIGKIAFPATEAAPAFCSTFPKLFNSREDVACLIPCAIDQDPYFRMCRDVAPRLSMLKPATIYSMFIPSLRGAHSKMSASDPNSAIFLTDTRKQIKDKINKYAFSGGGTSIEEHREKGGDCSVDIPFKYLQIFLDDDEKIEKIRQEYSSGSMLTGEIKKIAIDTITDIVLEHQKKRNAITDEQLKMFMTPRPLL